MKEMNPSTRATLPEQTDMSNWNNQPPIQPTVTYKRSNSPERSENSLNRRRRGGASPRDTWTDNPSDMDPEHLESDTLFQPQPTNCINRSGGNRKRQKGGNNWRARGKSPPYHVRGYLTCARFSGRRLRLEKKQGTTTKTHKRNPPRSKTEDPTRSTENNTHKDPHTSEVFSVSWVDALN